LQLNATTNPKSNLKPKPNPNPDTILNPNTKTNPNSPRTITTAIVLDFSQTLNLTLFLILTLKLTLILHLSLNMVNNVPRCLSQSMAPKCPVPKGPAPKLIHIYTPLIGPEAWLSMMGKRRMSSASTSTFYPLPHLQIRTSAFYIHFSSLPIIRQGGVLGVLVLQRIQAEEEE